ncbi:MAG TPA: glycosyltransferase, partial [Solirubrobacteraceae bacterium]|nr:glycosyltransferase [Solirubrobacteraceae bacterium]
HGRAKAVFSGELEVTADFKLPPRPITTTGQPYDEARLLVRVGGEPVGFATVSLGDEPLSPARVLGVIERDLDASVQAELMRQGLPPLRSLEAGGEAPRGELLAGTPGSERVTVVICTRNRAEALRGCLRFMRLLEHGALEFVIVDNAPADDSTRDLVVKLAGEDARFRYVREPHPGLSWARNRGLAHATGEIVAYTDDDVRVDRLWIRGLLRGFHRRADVACVTGLVASASLELAEEQYFDARVWWSSSCEHQVYDARHGPVGLTLHPYAAGGFGTGANFAFRTGPLREIGGFDESLGAGSPCAGGEDLDIFVRLLRAGYSISYEPAALVWHEHRTDHDDLRRQMYAYGKALSAYLFKYASSRRTALDMWRRLPHGIGHLGALGRRSGQAGSQAGLARELLLAELRGAMTGPLAYARARRAQDSERRRMVAP